MYLRTLTWMAVMTFLAALSQPDNLVAQSQQEQRKKDNRSYSITDLGTLGGNNNIPQAIDDRGQVAGFAETGDTDPNCGCPIFHAFRWSGGVLHDLGTLGGHDSAAGLGGINREGEVVGDSQTATVDPNNPPFLEDHAFLWRKGLMTDLGTLGGTYSFATAVDGDRRVVGGAQIFDPDPFSEPFHPFLWQEGVMRDLGTLGGPSGYAFGINPNQELSELRQEGTADKDQPQNTAKTKHRKIQVVGGANVDNTSVPPFVGPPFFAFLWENGVMTNLGALDGIQSVAVAINDRSQVAGSFTFLDSNGTGVTHALRWEHRRAQDLGTVTGDDDSIAWAINHNGQVVGASGAGFVDAFTSVHAFLWENGVLTDLNTLIPANSDLQLISAFGINVGGQIAALAYEFGTGNVHAVLLTPHHRNLTNQDAAPAVSAAIAGKPPIVLSETARNLLKMATPGAGRFRDGLNQK